VRLSDLLAQFLDTDTISPFFVSVMTNAEIHPTVQWLFLALFFFLLPHPTVSSALYEARVFIQRKHQSKSCSHRNSSDTVLECSFLVLAYPDCEGGSALPAPHHHHLLCGWWPSITMPTCEPLPNPPPHRPLGIIMYALPLESWAKVINILIGWRFMNIKTVRFDPKGKVFTQTEVP